jgi:hypothetical protein
VEDQAFKIGTTNVTKQPTQLSYVTTNDGTIQNRICTKVCTKLYSAIITTAIKTNNASGDECWSSSLHRKLKEDKLNVFILESIFYNGRKYFTVAYMHYIIYIDLFTNKLVPRLLLQVHRFCVSGDVTCKSKKKKSL